MRPESEWQAFLPKEAALLRLEGRENARFARGDRGKAHEQELKGRT